MNWQTSHISMKMLLPYSRTLFYVDKSCTLYFKELDFKLFIKVSFIWLEMHISEWTYSPFFAWRRCTVENIFLSQKKSWFVASLSKTKTVFTFSYNFSKWSRLRTYRTLPPFIFWKTVSMMFIVIFSFSLSGAQIKTTTSCFKRREDKLSTLDVNESSLDFLPRGKEKTSWV